MQEIFDDFHFFFYGVKVKLKNEELEREVVLKLNDTNFSFLELLSNSLKIVKSVCIYDILNVHHIDALQDLSLNLEFRMKNYEENFVITGSSSAEMKIIWTKL